MFVVFYQIAKKYNDPFFTVRVFLQHASKVSMFFVVKDDSCKDDLEVIEYFDRGEVHWGEYTDFETFNDFKTACAFAREITELEKKQIKHESEIQKILNEKIKKFNEGFKGEITNE